MELLITIGLIAVALALLLSAISQGRAHSVSIKCTGHLRQIYSAYTQFVTDHSNFLPPYREFPKDANGKPTNGTTWGAHLNPYYETTTARPTRCPGETNPSVTTTYAMNAAISDKGTLEPLSDPPPEKLLSVPLASQRFLITDSHNVMRITGGKFLEEASFRHPGERINILFLDGHIESHTRHSVPIAANGFTSSSPAHRAFWRGQP